MPLMKPRPSARRDATRRRILEAALSLFGHKGFERTTVREIADRCGLTDAALYYYFPTKQDMLETLLTENWRLSPGEPCGRRGHRATPEERLCQLADAMLDDLAENGAAIRFLRRAVIAGAPEAVAHRRQRWQAWVAYASDYIDETLSAAERRLIMDAVFTFVRGVGFLTHAEHGELTASVLSSPAFRAAIHEQLRIAAPIHLFARPNLRLA